MASAPMLHVASGNKRLSGVEACRLLADEVWRGERKLAGFRSGGLNSEKAVRQRLHGVAMELQRMPSLGEMVALHLHSIDWLEADPLTILERTEGLVDRQCRDTFATVESLLRDPDRATQLAAHLLILQGLGGRLGRWAVRAGEIPDARIARARYRDLGAPEWSQYCRLIEDANAAFEGFEYAKAVSKVFDADRLVRTPASLVTAALALSRIEDYLGALWVIRVCLLEPEETFESEAELRKARVLEVRLRDVVEGRSRGPVAIDDLLDEVESVGAIDIVEVKQDVLETERARLEGHAEAPVAAGGRWDERYLAEVVHDLAEVPFIQGLALPPLHRMADPSSESDPVEAAFFEASSLEPPLPQTELETARSAESILESESMQRLVSDAYELAFPPGEEVTVIPPAPADEAPSEETLVPPIASTLARLGERTILRDPEKVEAAFRAITAAAGLDLDELTLPEQVSRRKRPRRSATTTTERIERRVVRADLRDDPALEEVTAQVPARRPHSQPTNKIALKRVYEVTQVVRARPARSEELDSPTEQLSARSPLDGDG